LKRKSCASLFLVLALSVTLSLVLVNKVSAQAQSTYGFQVAFPQLAFSQPVGIYNAKDATNRLFVVEQAGRIQVFQNSATASATVFLDITDRVLFGGEQGLLGLAFHPNFASNGYFYVDYVAPSPTRTVISRYTVNPAAPNVADKSSELVLLEISQPFSNHKGGQLAFGPDGYLYIGMGDGGSQGDPQGNGQNRAVLLGKILRIDVNTASAGRSYGVPFDNPFAGNTAGYREEIYAFGFRNPWRFSFDSATGQLWVGDVGQSQIEEIDLVQKGKNYGWNIMEGTQLYAGGNQSGLELPVYEYDHSLGNAVIAGIVYHGGGIPALQGSYVYGDYGSGRIWALTFSRTTATANNLLLDSNLALSSFGVDQNGEIYVCAFDGKIYKLIATAIPELPPEGVAAILAASTLVAIAAFKKGKISFFVRGRRSP